MDNPIRVLVVDDSPFMRMTIARYLERDQAIVVVDRAADGVEAVEKVGRLKPDVVTMDVEMPRMDGLAALKQIMAENPTPVVMLSALTQRGAGTTIRALMRGAVDFVQKPGAGLDLRTVMGELITKVKVAGGVRPASTQECQPDRDPVVEKAGPRPFRSGDRLIVIGASTGGPRAVAEVLTRLPSDLGAAVVVVQHMPAGFTRSFAERLDARTSLSVHEAIGGDRLARGLALVAPGDYHLRLKGKGRVVLDQGAQVNHVRPAVDVTMESAAKQYGPAVVGVILTGMGIDGTKGAGRIRSAGGMVIAEDESTSVVYGMPRSVAEAGEVDRVVPLPRVAEVLVELVR